MALPPACNPGRTYFFFAAFFAGFFAAFFVAKTLTSLHTLKLIGTSSAHLHYRCQFLLSRDRERIGSDFLETLIPLQ